MPQPALNISVWLVGGGHSAARIRCADASQRHRGESFTHPPADAHTHRTTGRAAGPSRRRALQRRWCNYWCSCWPSIPLARIRFAPHRLDRPGMLRANERGVWSAALAALRSATLRAVAPRGLAGRGRRRPAAMRCMLRCMMHDCMSTAAHGCWLATLCAHALCQLAPRRPGPPTSKSKSSRRGAGWSWWMGGCWLLAGHWHCMADAGHPVATGYWQQHARPQK
jgi:hypothetical protein